MATWKPSLRELRTMIEKLKQFLLEVKLELKKVTWPRRNEVRGTTLVVLITVFIVGIFLAVVDVTLIKLRQLLFQFFGVS
jgi:preprotein translocase subunit SecE